MWLWLVLYCECRGVFEPENAASRAPLVAVLLWLYVLLERIKSHYFGKFGYFSQGVAPHRFLRDFFTLLCAM